MRSECALRGGLGTVRRGGLQRLVAGASSDDEDGKECTGCCRKEDARPGRDELLSGRHEHTEENGADADAKSTCKAGGHGHLLADESEGDQRSFVAGAEECASEGRCAGRGVA